MLKSVESSLTNFQRDLGAVSAEIETLQSRSSILNTRLENRKGVEKLLGPAIENLSISPSVVKIISEGPIDENWAKAITDLEKRSQIIDRKLKETDQVLAARDIKPILDDLTNLVLSLKPYQRDPTRLMSLSRLLNVYEISSYHKSKLCAHQTSTHK